MKKIIILLKRKEFGNMKKSIVISLILILRFTDSTSQTLQWAKQFGGTQADIAFSNAIDQAGNIYTTGYSGIPRKKWTNY